MAKKTREEVAYERANLINPLLDDRLDKAKAAQRMRELCQMHGVSERTLRRWLLAFKKEGFNGLMPAEREGKASVIPEEVIDEAVLLRREVPQRSVRDIIRLLELEGRVVPGEVKRSTLQDQLEKRGFGSRQLSMYRGAGEGALRRFEYKERNALWQADIKYLLVLPATADRPQTQLYVSAFLDDATRMVTACKVYRQQDVDTVLRSFREAMEVYGVPARLFTDNGKQYISKALSSCCQKLGIKLMHARPYAAQAKGKIEAFNRTLDKFVNEEILQHPQSVAQVQYDLDTWLEHFYYNMPHSGLKGETAKAAWLRQTNELRTLDSQRLNEAFAMSETRLVSKDGCLSFKGERWEAGTSYIGFRVNVTYNPHDPDRLLIDHPSLGPVEIHRIQMLSHTRKEPRPVGTPVPDGSRILKAAHKHAPSIPGVTRFKDLVEAKP